MAEMTREEWEAYIRMLMQGAPPASPVYRRATILDDLKGMPTIPGSALTPEASTILPPRRTTAPVESPSIEELKGFPAIPGSAIASKEEEQRAIDPRDLITSLNRLGKPAMKPGAGTALLREGGDPFAAREQPREGDSVAIPGYATGELPERLRRIFDFSGKANKALAAADEEKRLRMMESMKGLGEGLDLMGRGMAGTKGHLYPDEFRPAGMEQLSREIEREEDKITPLEAQMMQDAFGIQIEAGMPWSRVSRVLPSVAQAVRMQTSTELSRQKYLDRNQEKQMGAKENIYYKFKSRVNVKNIEQAFGELNTIRSLLNEEIESASDRGAMTKIPKMLGDVGRLSDFDIQRHEKRMGLYNRAKDIASQALKGVFSVDHRKQINNMVNTIEKSLKESYWMLANEEADSTSKIYSFYGIPKKEIVEFLAPRGAPESTDEIPLENMTPLRDKTTGKLMWWYPENEGDTWDRTKYEEVE